MINKDRWEETLERRQRTIAKLSMVYGALSLLLAVSILGFLGWVCVKLLQHFGVVG